MLSDIGEWRANLEGLNFQKINEREAERLEIPFIVARIKISVNTDISVIGFYGNIGNIGKISVDIFTKISVQLKFFIF